MSTTGKKVDIRAIDLIKNARKLTEKAPDGIDTYACIGHFEVMQIRKVNRGESNSPFKDIWRDSCERNDRAYNYPLYILRSGDTSKMDKFWRMRYPCIVVSRVHFDLPDNNLQPDDIAINTMIDKCVNEICSRTSIQQVVNSECSEYRELMVTDSVGSEDKVICAFYQTLELGDVAVILKSNSLIACMTIAKNLMEHNMVGNVYSYCGLHRELLKGYQACNFSSNSREVQGALNEKIPHVNMRFSVHSTHFANLLWKKMGVKDRVKFVTGTADAAVDLAECNCLDLIEIIRILLEDHTVDDQKNRNKNRKTYNYSDAFDDVITRIGIEFGEISENTKSPADILKENKPDAEGQKELHDRIEAIRAKLKKVVSADEYDWFISLSAQVNTLLTMMNNCIMDDLSLLIWPSVKAFVARLYTLVIDEKVTLDTDKIGDIETFLDGWATLSNDITHLESQLVQNPKLQASRAYIPAALLAFYMAFTDKLNGLLHEIDVFQSREHESDRGAAIPERRYYPLITHSIGLRPNTVCILDPCTDASGSIGNKDGYPLLVSIPISLMYSPDEVSAILCHEYLHYAGESTRLREKRYECILSSCAVMIINRWYLDGRNESPLTLSSLDGSFAPVKNELVKEIKAKMKMPDKKAPLFIHLMKNMLPGIISNIYLDWQLQSRLLTSYINADELQNGFIVYARQFLPANWYDDTETMHQQLEELLILYKECYADVAAVILLDLDVKGYLTNIYAREINIKNKTAGDWPKDRRSQLLAIRAALVLGTVSCVLNRSSSFLESNEWYRSVKRYTELIKQEEDLQLEDGSFFLSYQYIPLDGYLKDCAEKITESLADTEVNGKALELRDLYSMISNSEVDLVKFRKVIDRYHINISKGEKTNQMRS